MSAAPFTSNGPSFKIIKSSDGRQMWKQWGDAACVWKHYNIKGHTLHTHMASIVRLCLKRWMYVQVLTKRWDYNHACVCVCARDSERETNISHQHQHQQHINCVVCVYLEAGRRSAMWFVDVHGYKLPSPSSVFMEHLWHKDNTWGAAGKHTHTHTYKKNNNNMHY